MGAKRARSPGDARTFGCPACASQRSPPCLPGESGVDAARSRALRARQPHSSATAGVVAHDAKTLGHASRSTSDRERGSAPGPRALDGPPLGTYACGPSRSGPGQVFRWSEESVRRAWKAGRTCCGWVGLTRRKTSTRYSALSPSFARLADQNAWYSSAPQAGMSSFSDIESSVEFESVPSSDCQRSGVSCPPGTPARQRLLFPQPRKRSGCRSSRRWLAVPPSSQAIFQLSEKSAVMRPCMCPQRIAEVTEALCRTLTDPELSATMRQRGLERVSAFDWQNTARETLQHLHAVVES